MDKTELYIKMSDCPEIQGLAPERHGCEIHGEWFVGLPSGWVLSEDGGYYYGEHMEDTKVVWLPRQDQLQEMVTSQDLAHYEVINPNEPPLIDNLLSAFQQFSNKQPWMGKADTIGNRPSMEQLWLAFVMKQRYNKAWNGEEWVKA